MTSPMGRLWHIYQRALRRTLGALDGMDRSSRVPRLWSNRELRRVASLCPGRVINVSAWKDEDREGRHYRDYFTGASEYVISNMPGPRGAETAGGLALDLTAPLPEALRGAFDVVFNHTTLEHIPRVQEALANLCALSRGAVIVVVPFLQHAHGVPGLGDYWRFTPQGLRWLFANGGFTVLYESATAGHRTAVYLFVVAARESTPWTARLPRARLPDDRLGERELGVYQPWLRALRLWLLRGVEASEP